MIGLLIFLFIILPIAIGAIEGAIDGVAATYHRIRFNMIPDEKRMTEASVEKPVPDNVVPLRRHS